MQLPQPFVLLPHRFDAGRLRGEVDALPDDAWRRHPSGHPGNSAASLVSVGGDHTDDSVGGRLATTTWLRPDSYLAQTIASFGVSVGRTRLMRIDPGAEATPHFDVHLYWFDRVRIHVPIITTNDVEFLCGDSSTHMAPGESWLFDTFRLHNVTNPGGSARVHLVIDTVGTPALWDMMRASVAGEMATIDVVHEPDRVPLVLPEQVNIAPVMPPSQMMSVWQRLDGHVPTDPAGDRIRASVAQFIETWQTLWALHGSTPGAVGYAAEIERFSDEILALDDVRLPYNGSSANSTVRTLVAGSAISHSVSAGGRRASDASVSTAADHSDETASGASTEARSAARRVASDGASTVGLRATARGTSTGSSPVSTSETQGDPRFDRPIIIVAPPRSGSTLLFETLAKAPGLFTIGRESHMLIESVPGLTPADHGWHSNELTVADATPEVVRALRDAFFDDLRDRNGQPPPMEGTGLRFLEKTPKNALRIEFLDQVFPDARFVFLSRDPRSEISSMIDAWRSGGFVTYPDLPGWKAAPWSLLLTPNWRELNGRTVQEICAAQWECATSTILDDLDRVAPGRWTVADYERLVSDPVTEMQRLCRFADLSWDDPLDGVLPLSRHTLSPPNPEKWRNNATELAEVLPGVSDTAERAAAVVGGARPTSSPVSAQPPTRRGEAVDSTGPSASAVGGIGNDPDVDRDAAAVDVGVHPMGSVHTASVPELLGAAGASLVVSTYQSARVITLREMGGELNTHFTSVPRPMGVAWRPGSAEWGSGALAIGTSNEVWTYRDQPAVAGRLAPSGTYGSCYVLRDRHVTGDISIHEMAYGGDGELWAVNTRFSCLSTLDDDHSFVPRWMPPFVTELDADDRCHLNGMAMRAGAPAFVTMFSESDQPNGWRDTRAFGGLVMDVASGEVVTSGLCMPHSPRWYRDQLFVLESGRGTLSRVDLASGECRTIVELPGFTRGLAFIGRYALIGLSQVRESVFAGLPLTTSDRPRHSGVWVVDLDTSEVVGFVRFDGLVQEVFDLQIVFPAAPAASAARPGAVSNESDDSSNGTLTGRHVHVMDLDDELHPTSFVVPRLDGLPTGR